MVTGSVGLWKGLVCKCEFTKELIVTIVQKLTRNMSILGRDEYT